MKPSHALATALLALFSATQGTSQGAAQGGGLEPVPLRVTQYRPGPPASVVVDRGARDGLLEGDLVQLFPRDSGVRRGAVVQVTERSAVVELSDPGDSIAVATRGEALLPVARRAAPDPDTTPKVPTFSEPDSGYRTGMPLLTQIRPVRPERRPTRMTTRLWAGGDARYSTTEEFDDAFGRAGIDLRLENPLQEGGELQLDAEFNGKTERNDQSGIDLLVHRLSYARGGTRFSPHRWQAGRFLQHGVPEFGVLDGVEYGVRLEDGARFGASFGFLPEPDDDYESLEDLQAAVHYQWSRDPRERFTLRGAFQKTLHNGKTDRDLLLLGGRLLPDALLADAGWQLHGTLWIDLYHGRDDTKGSGPELTQALLSARRHWRDRGGIDLSYRRLVFPEILRNEFVRPVTPAEIADNRYDKLSLAGWRRWSERARVHGLIAGFDDEDFTGGAIEGGFEQRQLWRENDTADLTLFGASTEFESVLGVRGSYSVLAENGSWDVLYELGHHHFLGFADDADDLFQHRLLAGRAWQTASGTRIALQGQAQLWDEETSLSLGFHVERTF